MVKEDTVLKYFYKQNKQLTIDDLMESFGMNDSILKPINNLVDEDWLEEIEPLKWQITDEGRKEFERRHNLNNSQLAVQDTTIDFERDHSVERNADAIKEIKIFISWSGDRSKLTTVKPSVG